MRGGLLVNPPGWSHDHCMENKSFAGALGTLTEQLASGMDLEPQQLLQAEASCLQLFELIGAQATATSDPRVALAHATFTEAFSRQSTRATIIAASTVETTAAHALHVNEFDDLRAGLTDFSAEPVFAPGRTLYKDAAEALSSVLGLNYFEAARRVSDAHLVHARRDITGAGCAPRFTRLAEHFAPHPALDSAPDSTASGDRSWQLPEVASRPDPREVLKTARALEKFEPTDTTFEGIPTSATATASDGELLESHAATYLNEPQVRTRNKRLNTLIRNYKEENGETKTPQLGLFRGKVVNGVHEFIVRVRAMDAEVWESLIAQADNKRTKAGAAARASCQTADPSANPSAESSTDPAPSGQAAGERTSQNDGTARPETKAGAEPESAPDAEPEIDELWHSDDPIPDWARTHEAPNDAGPNDAGPAESATPDLAHPLNGPPVIMGDCSVPERRLNALNAILRNADPGSTGQRVTPEIVVHANYADLRDLASLTGLSAHGVKLSAPELRTMLCEAKILSPIYNADGVIMDIGRDARLFPRWMKLAARDRDGGCLVPGCTAEPELLEFHHFKPWAKGGRTRLQDCCPLCTKHHVMVHSGYLTLVKIKGLVYVILPKHLDPDQIPRRNTYFART